MSYTYNKNRKKERMISRLKNMTISEFQKLRPDEVKSHKRIVAFIKENNIKLKVN